MKVCSPWRDRNRFCPVLWIGDASLIGGQKVLAKYSIILTKTRFRMSAGRGPIPG